MSKTSHNKPFVSVVIALKNEMGYIQKCLKSFLNQSYGMDNYEILIYDGRSTDGTLEYLKKIASHFPNIKIFDNPKEVAAAGWNAGFKEAKGKYVVMMGGHTYVAYDFIEKNVQLLENSSAPCVGGSVIAVGKDKKSKAIALAFNHPFGVGNARYRYAQKPCYVETVNYGMYRKSVILDIGPIDENLKRGEDWEYNYRIVKKYGKMIYSPEIKSFYFSRANFTHLWKRQFDAGLYKLEIIRKFPGSILLRHIIPFLFALMVIVLPLLVLFGLDPKFLIAFWALYLSVNISISFWISVKKGLKYFPYLLWAFFIMQFAYGVGFILGVFKLIKDLLYKIFQYHKKLLTLFPLL